MFLRERDSRLARREVVANAHDRLHARGSRSLQHQRQIVMKGGVHEVRVGIYEHVVSF
jgi:hypothetical protein